MSYLRDYLLYSSGNEAPEMFHVWGGYVTLSAAVSRKVWLPFGKSPMYPNIYVMYVGPAGNGKSSAMAHAERLLKRIDRIPISASVETPEGILRFMAGDPGTAEKPGRDYEFKFMAKGPGGVMVECNPMTIIANEYIDFISKNPEGWTNLLNNVYDVDNYLYRTKNQGTDSLPGPYFVLLGALTTEVSAELHKAKIISTGLSRRTLFQYGERQFHRPCAIPTYTPEQRAAEARCLAHLKELRALNGEFSWSPETQKWWIEWYNAHNVKVPQKAPQVRGWFASKPDQVLKLGILTALAEDSKGLVLRADHLETGLLFLERLESDLMKVFGGVGRNEVAQIAINIKNYIYNQLEPVSYKRLWSTFFHECKSREELDTAIAYLLDNGEIVEALATVGAVTERIFGSSKEAIQRFEAAARLGVPVSATLPVKREDSVGEAGP